MTIFQKSVIKRHLDNLDKDQVEKAYQKFRENYSPAKIEEIKKLKEEEYQDGFLRDLFVDVFGYILKPDSNYNLAREFKNQGDGKKADGAILARGHVPLGDKAVAVIELKSTKTKDLKSITDQAFNYKYNQPECKYVITSNFQKLRFYIDYAHEYEEFDLFNLQKEDFELLYLLLNANSVFSDLPLKLKEATKFHEQEVSDKLYKDYSIFKSKLFENLIKNNPENDKLTLFNKSQKLLDRFLFILFAEDSGLLPPNSISRIIDTYHKLEELYQEKPIYDIYKQYFGFMNTGRKGKTNADNIPAYNGGLFYNDELLDNLKIDDSILIDDLLKLSEYDFNTEVDVNILGHIFEHSLSEIEEITAEINAGEHAPLRKKDGVFYTPKYITQYIVENTIGTLCNEKRKELEIEEIEFDGSYRNKKAKDHAPSLSAKGKKLYQKLNDYKEWLLSLKIVDPACGSGAFLNQALNFLIAEHKNIDDIIAELTNTALRLFDTDKAILENNLYGVDINEESVEIAKLSLWLRTAQKGRKLSSLNDNIKCGNSLIDDPEIAGEKAFNWNVEFPQIFKKKEKIAWHITTATHNSRYSQRMYDNHVKLGEPVWLSEKEELIVTEKIAEIVKEDKLNVLAYNICGDHFHIILVCEKDEVPKIMQKIKSISARTCNIAMGRTVPSDAPGAEEHVPLHKTRGITQTHLWTRKSGTKEILSDEQLSNTINYIRTNRQKHDLPENKILKKVINEMCCSVEHAFQTEYNGGFDVVIGNPPYVNIVNIENINHRNYFQKKYATYKNKSDLYSFFIEREISILKDNGLFGNIFPNSWMGTSSFSRFRKYLLKNTKINNLVKLPTGVFKDAIVTTVIMTFEKNQDVNDHHAIQLQEYTNQSFQDFKFELKYKEILQIESCTFSFEKKISLKGDCILGEVADFALGIKTSDDKRFVFNEKKSENHLPFLRGKNISKYYYEYGGEYLWYMPNLIKEKSGGRPRVLDHYLKDKIIIQDIAKKITATFDNKQYLVNDTINIIHKTQDSISLLYILALLNSRLINTWFRNTFPEGLHIKINQLQEIPIKLNNVESQEKLVKLAIKMLELKHEFKESGNKFLSRVNDNLEIARISNRLITFYDYDFKTFITELKKQKIKLSLTQQDEWEEYFNAYKTEINLLQNEINKTDKEIDQMVYELYGLTEVEIKIVEECA